MAELQRAMRRFQKVLENTGKLAFTTAIRLARRTKDRGYEMIASSLRMFKKPSESIILK
jgi:ribosomal protein S21